jgi:4-amino-4-deoxy-L-arabinose transferase-like glycosyltransferase
MMLVAFALRAGYMLLAHGTHPVPSSDSAEYDTAAWNIARGLGLALDGRGGSYATAFIPPVVPWITALLYRAAGHDYLAALLLQCSIGALVPPLTGALAAVLFGGGVGALAGWLAVVSPLLVFFSGYLLTETTFCVALLLALLATAAWVKTPRAGRALGVGLAWGAAALTRPTALALPLVAVAWGWVPLGLMMSGRDRVRHAFVLLLGVVLVVGPWTLRNAARLHAFVPVTTGGGRALLDSNNPVVWNDPARRGGATSTYDIEPWASRFRGLTEPASDGWARGEAIAFLRGHVRDWPAMAGAKLARFWRVTAEGGGTGRWLRPGSPLSDVARFADPLLLWSLLVLPLALWALVRTWRGPRRWFQLLPALVIAYFSAVAVVFWGALRMRVPVEPLVTVYAAAGLDDVRRRLRTRARGLRVVEGRRQAPTLP